MEKKKSKKFAAAFSAAEFEKERKLAAEELKSAKAFLLIANDGIGTSTMLTAADRADLIPVILNALDAIRKIAVMGRSK